MPKGYIKGQRRKWIRSHLLSLGYKVEDLNVLYENIDGFEFLPPSIDIELQLRDKVIDNESVRLAGIEYSQRTHDLLMALAKTLIDYARRFDTEAKKLRVSKAVKLQTSLRNAETKKAVTR